MTHEERRPLAAAEAREILTSVSHSYYDLNPELTFKLAEIVWDGNPHIACPRCGTVH